MTLHSAQGYSLLEEGSCIINCGPAGLAQWAWPPRQLMNAGRWARFPGTQVSSRLWITMWAVVIIAWSWLLPWSLRQRVHTPAYALRSESWGLLRASRGKEEESFLLSLFPEEKNYKWSKVRKGILPPPPDSVFSLMPTRIWDTMVIGVIEIARDRRSIAEKALHSVLSTQWEMSQAGGCREFSHLFTSCSLR